MRAKNGFSVRRALNTDLVTDARS